MMQNATPLEAVLKRDRIIVLAGLAGVAALRGNFSGGTT